MNNVDGCSGACRCSHAPLSERATPRRHIIRFTVACIFRVTRSITAVMEKHAHAKDNYALIALNLWNNLLYNAGRGRGRGRRGHRPSAEEREAEKRSAECAQSGDQRTERNGTGHAVASRNLPSVRESKGGDGGGGGGDEKSSGNERCKTIDGMKKKKKKKTKRTVSDGISIFRIANVF